MKRATKSVTASLTLLPQLIEETVALEMQAGVLEARIKINRDAIKATLRENNMERTATPSGCEALVITKTALSWSLEKIQELCGKNVKTFELLCPRKPDSAALRALLEASSEEKYRNNLRACAKASKSYELELRSPVDTAALKPTPTAA